MLLIIVAICSGAYYFWSRYQASTRYSVNTELNAEFAANQKTKDGASSAPSSLLTTENAPNDIRFAFYKDNAVWLHENGSSRRVSPAGHFVGRFAYHDSTNKLVYTWSDRQLYWNSPYNPFHTIDTRDEDLMYTKPHSIELVNLTTNSSQTIFHIETLEDLENGPTMPPINDERALADFYERFTNDHDLKVEQVWDVQFSPDGTIIAFSTAKSVELYSIAEKVATKFVELIDPADYPEGTFERVESPDQKGKITSGNVRYGINSFSPDGKYLVYHLVAGDGRNLLSRQNELYVDSINPNDRRLSLYIPPEEYSSFREFVGWITPTQIVVEENLVKGNGTLFSIFDVVSTKKTPLHTFADIDSEKEGTYIYATSSKLLDGKMYYVVVESDLSKALPGDYSAVETPRKLVTVDLHSAVTEKPWTIQSGLWASQLATGTLLSHGVNKTHTQSEGIYIFDLNKGNTKLLEPGAVLIGEW